MIDQDIQALQKEFFNELQNAQTTTLIEALKVKYLGKKGPIQNLMKALKDVSPEDRPQVGKLINDLKEEISKKIGELESQLVLEASILLRKHWIILSKS
jgi:phenylalanyl-tRNA synthetase alpha chain